MPLLLLEQQEGLPPPVSAPVPYVNSGTMSLRLGGIEVAPGWPGPYCLLAGMSLGDPKALTSVVEGLLLDGDQVTGDASGNREISLDIVVSAINAQVLSSYLTPIEALVDSPSWTMDYTPPGGATTTFDCLRGQVTTDYELEQHPLSYGPLTTIVHLDFPCLPFGRSPQRQTLVAGNKVTVSNLTPGVGVQVARQSAQSRGSTVMPQSSYTYTYVGPTAPAYSSYSRLTITDPYCQPGLDIAYAATLSGTLSAFNFSTDATVGVYARAGSSTATPRARTQPAILLLTDGNGRQAQIQATWNPTYGSMFDHVVWSLAGVTGIDLTNVTAFEFALAYEMVATSTTTTSTLDLFGLIAYPSLAGEAGGVDGTYYSVNGVMGTARAPVASLLHRSGGVVGAVQHTPPASGNPRVAPLVPLFYTGTTGQTSGAFMLPADDQGQAGLRYQGTYAVWITLYSKDSGTQSRSVTITAVQYSGDGSGGPSQTSFAMTRTYSSADIASGLLYVGQVTLPLRTWPSDNMTATHGWNLASSGSSDTFASILVMDMDGSTVILGATPGGYAYPYLAVKEPDPQTQHQPVLVGATAASLMGCWEATDASNQFSVSPPSVGPQGLMVVIPGGAPDQTTLTYAPRWRRIRTDTATPLPTVGFGISPFGTAGFGL